MYLNALNSGPPDLEEWFKKIGRSFTSKKNPLTGSSENNEASSRWWFFIIAILCLVVLLFSSVITVKPSEKLVVTRFGAFLYVAGPGLHWTLPLVDQRTVVDVTTIQALSDQATFLTKEGSLVKVSLVLNYQISDPQKYLFYGPVNLLLQKQLMAATTQVLAGQNAVALLSAHAWSNLNDQVQRALPDLSAYGVSLKGVSVNNVSVPDALSQKFNTVIQAAQNQVQQMMTSANQFAASIKPLAAQQAAQALQNANTNQFSILMNAQKDAAEMQSLQAAYQLNPAVTTVYLPLLLLRQNSTDLLVSKGQVQSSTQNAAYLRWRTSNSAAIQEAQDAQAN